MIFHIILIINFFVIAISEPIGVSNTTAATTAETATVQDLRNFSNNVLTTMKPSQLSHLNLTGNRPTRRILAGRIVGDTRPYMVYLRAAIVKGVHINIDEEHWLCGGVIIHERYVLTSAACIENAMHFYVVSGTHKWHAGSVRNNDCINNGAKKAVWKCVPKSYVYDGPEFDNIRWMVNDIAVVKVEDEFNFEKRIKGCDFVPQKVAYNNITLEHEKPNNIASIAGWGSTEYFTDLATMEKATVIPPTTFTESLPSQATKEPAMLGRNEIRTPKKKLRDGYEGFEFTREPSNSPDLLETEVVLLSKKACKKRWPERYHYIIDRYAICGKDSTDTESMSKACAEHEVNCKELVYSQEEDEDERRMGKYYYSRRAIAKSGKKSGGFCENDHGGPLIVGYGKTSLVIGVISACLTTAITSKCHGPFLYTSVFNNRHLISCAIDKEMGATCKKLLRTSQTHMHETNFVWANHPHGPAKSEHGDDYDEDDDARKQVENKPEGEDNNGVPFRSMQSRPDSENLPDTTGIPLDAPGVKALRLGFNEDLTSTITSPSILADELNIPTGSEDE